MAASLLDYLSWTVGETIPPLCLEIVLKSGRSFFVAHVFRFEADDPMITVRVWDTRAMDESDLAELLSNLNKVRDRSATGLARRPRYHGERRLTRGAPELPTGCRDRRSSREHSALSPGATAPTHNHRSA